MLQETIQRDSVSIEDMATEHKGPLRPRARSVHRIEPPCTKWQRLLGRVSEDCFSPFPLEKHLYFSNTIESKVASDRGEELLKVAERPGRLHKISRV